MKSIPFKIFRDEKEIALRPGSFDFDLSVGKNYIRLNESTDIHTGDILNCHNGKFNFFVLSIHPIHNHDGKLHYVKVFYEALEERELREAEEAKKQKSQFHHDWLLTTYSLLTGAIAGALASFVFNLITQN